MRFLMIIIFSSNLVNSQTKGNLHEGFYFDFNIGLSTCKYELDYPGGYEEYLSQKGSWLSGKIGVAYISPYLQGELNLNLINVLFLEPKLSVNIFGFRNESFHRLGPFYSLDWNIHNHYIYNQLGMHNLGMEYSYKKFHISCFYSKLFFKPNYTSARNANAISFSLGYNLGFDSFKKNKPK